MNENKTQMKNWQAWLIAGVLALVGGFLFIRDRGGDLAAASRAPRSQVKFASVPLPSNTMALGVQSLSRFKATADKKKDAGLFSFPFTITNKGASLSDLELYAFTDAGFSDPAPGAATPAGLVASRPGGVAPGVSRITLTASSTPAGLLGIPAGAARYFDLRGLILGNPPGAKVTTKFDGLSGQTITVPKRIQKPPK